MATAIEAWPFEDSIVSEEQYGLLHSLFQDVGLSALPSDPDGKVSAGSGFQLLVAPIPLGYAAGVAFRSASTVAVTIPAANTTARVDRVVARIDSSANAAVIDVVTGSPGSATPATLSRDVGGEFEVPLALVNVPANALNIVAANITDDRRFCGVRVGRWTTGTRPSMRPGKLGYNYSFTPPRLEECTGTRWKPVAVGARMVGTAAERTALDAADLFDGLEFYETDTRRELLWRGVTAGWYTKETDSGWVLSQIGMQTGWGGRAAPDGSTGDAGTGGVRVRNGMAELRLRFTRSGTAIGTSASSGNVSPDVPIAQLPSWARPESPVYGDFYRVGVMQGSARIDPTGMLTLTDLGYPNASLPKDASCQVQFFYFL